MKIYLAGSTKEIIRAKALALDIAAEGHEVLHAWTMLPQDGSAAPERMIWRTCLRQIREADCVVALAPHDPRVKLNGAVFECGYALARGLPVIVYDTHRQQTGTWFYAEGAVIVYDWQRLLEELSF